MRILRATHLGMCFGVRDAIALALQQTRPITVLGDLVHNETVLKQLQDHGIDIRRDIRDVRTETVMITAHGASDQARARLHQQGFQVLEATCPLVHHAHRAVASLAAEGYHPVIIGRRDHVEVRGLTEDLAAFDVVLTEEDVAQLAYHPRIGIAAQTTQPIDRVRWLAHRIRVRFPEAEVRFIDTVCQPTKQRQTAAIELATQTDVVIVIGGVNSSNTRELVVTCAQYCARVHHVQSAADLRAFWFTGREKTVGLTAGTSTPDHVIAEVEQWLHDFCLFQEKLSECADVSARELASPSATGNRDRGD